MLKEAKYTLADGEVKTVQVGFVQPDELMLSGMTQSNQKAIEYQTDDLPGFTEKSRLEIDGVIYRARNYPAKQGDGFFSKVNVEEVKE